ncbi:uncharacterized protein LOC141910307 [Tubulanus polymorphus]|uniref:uncharacterized protein LOC141910307 n=1 Tax=Tubulanus polymorphus TaxID=672921 RepID=UPI003DA62D87
MSDLESLKAIRTAQRKVLTRYVNDAKVILSINNPEDVQKLSNIADKIRSKLHVFSTNHDEIIPLLSAVDIEKVFEEHDRYEVNAESTLYEISGFSSRQSQSNLSISEFKHVQLPKLQLPKFNGNVLDWNNFWDSFDCVVHKRHDLSEVDKFTYLKSCLIGPALSSIAGLSSSGGGTYSHAVKILQDRFGQSRRLIHAYMEAMLEINKPSYTAASLRLFYDNMNISKYFSRSLGQRLDSRRIITVLSNELDLLELYSNNSTESQDVQFSTFLTKTQSGVNSGSKFNRFSKYPRTSRNCVYCCENHASVNCQKYSTVEDRFKFVSDNRLCRNCLRSDHFVIFCKSEIRCKICHGKHHISLCLKELAISSPKGSNLHSGKPMIASHLSDRAQSCDSPTRNSPTNRHSHATSDLPLTPLKRVSDLPQKRIESTTTVIQSQSNCILLKTAVLHVSGDNGISSEMNALFDDGSHRTFISKNFAEFLDLKPIRTEVVNISGFGSSDENNSDRRLGSLDIDPQLDFRSI